MIWPEEIVKKIAKRQAVLFLGSGISANSISADGTKRPPTWEKFIGSAQEQISNRKIRNYIQDLVKEKDYLTACEVLVNQLGESGFEQIVRNEFLTPQYKSHEIHKSIFLLDSKIVITPNVDKIYEVFSQTETAGNTLIKRYYDSDLVNMVRADARIVLKMHGTIDDSSKMIFTRSQYTRARYENASFYRFLEALALNYVFIFLGCGFSDPDIQLVLENYSFIFPGSPPHYFITPQEEVNDEFKKILKDNRNLEVITYSNKNHHEELQRALKELVILVEDERDKIAEAKDW